MDFRILGPLEVATGGQRHEFGPRQATVTAALLLSANNVVSVTALIEAVWDERPPATARRQIQNSIWMLRRHLTIDTDRSGYRLCVPDGQLDAQVFANLIAQANAAITDGQLTQALTHLQTALQLWRGPALSGICGRTIEAAAARLDEQRLTALEHRIDLELKLGRPDNLIGELTELVATYPLRERLVGHLMRALHGCGRRSDALATYHQLRTRLAEELGIDPGADLQELHSMILGDHTNPTTASSQPTTSPAAQPRDAPARRLEAASSHHPRSESIPRQLPRDVADLAGRVEELRALDNILAGSDLAASSAIVAITGTAGVGKTTLAVHWAHQIANRFPDGQLYVDLRGFDPCGTPTAPASAIRWFLDALQVPPHRIPAQPDAQVALYRSVMAARRMLVVLDNARDAQQVRPLIPGTRGCLILVTSRHQLTGLIASEHAHPITLAVLSTAGARELLARRLDAQRVAAEPTAVDDLITWCARLPLALAIAAARAATRPDLTLAAHVADMRDTASSGLDAFDTGDAATDTRAVFSWSYRILTPDAARLFRLLGLHPGPDISAAAAASLAGILPTDVRRLLGTLTQAHLLTERVPGRFAFHDLLRAYAAELTHTIDPHDERHAATHRLLDHYLHTAHTAARLFYPNRDSITITPHRPGANPEHLADRHQALTWFTTEHPNLLAAVHHATDTGLDTHTWQLAWAIADYLDRLGHWHDHAAVQLAAVAAAQRLEDPLTQARTHRLLANAYNRLSRFNDAHAHLQHALALYGRTGDHAGQAHAHHTLAQMWEWRAQPTEALHHARSSLDLYTAAGHRVGQANALNAVGWYHAQLGDHLQALTYCQQSLTLHQEIKDHAGQAGAWDSLGYAHHHLGSHAQAITCYQHALDLRRYNADRLAEGETLIHLGDTHHAAGDTNAARAAWQHALAILDDLAHPDAAQARAKLHHLDLRPA